VETWMADRQFTRSRFLSSYPAKCRGPYHAMARSEARSTWNVNEAVLHGLHRVHYFCTSRQGHIASIIAMRTGKICKAFPNELSSYTVLFSLSRAIESQELPADALLKGYDG
jgi:hypothetical protein